MKINRCKHLSTVENDLSFSWDVKVGCFTFSKKFYHTFNSKDEQHDLNLVSSQLPFEGSIQNSIAAYLQECYFSNTPLLGYFEHHTNASSAPSPYRIKLLPHHSGKPHPQEITASITIIKAPEPNDLILSKWHRLNQLNVALIEFDEHANITCANLAWEKYIGRPFWMLFSVPFTHLFHPEDRAMWDNNFRQTSIPKSVDSSFKIRVLHSSGQQILMDCRISHSAKFEGKVLRTFIFSPAPHKLGQLLNIIPHQHIAIEQTHEGIAIVNADQKFIYLNQAHVELFGYITDLELIGKTWHILYDADEQRRITHEIFPRLENQKSIRYECRGIKKDGATIFQNVCLTRLPNGYIICTTHDITERKDQENRLKEIATIAKFTTMMVLVTNKHGVVTWINNAFTHKTAWQEKEIIGQSILTCLTFNTKLFDEAENIALSIEKGCLFNGEHRIVSKSKQIIWVESNLTPVHNASGEVHQFILIQNDITLRKQAENDILQAFQKEQELNRLKNQFIQLTSHEFRTPMASIYTSMDVMKHYLKNGDFINFKSVFERHYVNVVKEINRLEKTMNHILILGRHDSEKNNLNPKL